MGLPENIRKNIRQQDYEAGHMMYLHDEDLAKLKKNVAGFIDSTSKP
jgi:carboxypeptidase C (cathepsin A)